MCGLAGIVSLEERPVQPEAIKRMCDIQAHRGPDDGGYLLFRLGEPGSKEGLYWRRFTDPAFRHSNRHLPVWGDEYWRDEMNPGHFSIAMGHRRLSIIDLTHKGHQPMSSSDRRYWVVYNGEIYNFGRLRRQLKEKGHIFRTRTDTEVLLHLWEENGRDCLPLLNGMFAFALYDSRENILTLARDRFGVKPLYYAFTDDFFVFASEIKGILASRVMTPGIDRGGLVEYFSFQNTFGAQTLFKDIHMLRPGEYLAIRPKSGGRKQPNRYHSSFPEVNPALAGADAAKERVAETFAAAVTRQLVSDVEVGSYLSGGMDSGSIVAVAAGQTSRLLTFTGGFDLTNVSGIEQAFDERELAEQLSYLFQTEHYAVVLHSGDLAAALDKITWHMDDPRVGICYHNWYVAKLAGRFVKVCLTGAGGDELFAGYPWRYLRGMNAGSPEELDRAYFEYWRRLLPPGQLPKLFAADVYSDVADRPAESFRRVMAEAPGPQKDLSLQDNLLQRMLYFEFKTFLHGFLVTEDHISMAHGLE
ncbi:MAG: asparagine synthase (glutamine-hydrolyzing), partial [Thermodesulfobacteriota bacterium]|nr:asparagine synthase (glutamine-hydrolyzing) [Thermodesulfobacteriota bacterium]